MFLVSNEVPEVPVVSPTSGAVFEKRIIEKYIIENGVDPINGKELRVEDRSFSSKLNQERIKSHSDAASTTAFFKMSVL